MKKRIHLTGMLCCFALARLFGQGSDPAPFDMSNGANYMLFAYYHCLQPSCSPPQYMAIGEEQTSAQGNFVSPIGADASYGTAAGNWYAQGLDGLSFQGASGETRACFRLGLITTDRSNIAIEWKVRDIQVNPNTNFVEFQYRIGDAGDFTNVEGDLYQQGTTPSGTIFTLTLPAEANNQPLVQVRWIYYETGSGDRDRLSIDDITVSSSPLPVELMRFDAFARGSEVRLEWETATEQQNARFEVERSANGQDFSTLQTLPGAGTSRDPHRYACTDQEPLHGHSFYRLRQVDFDGGYAFSPVRAVQFGPRTQVRLLPTLAQEEILATLEGPADADQLWAVTDLQGHVVMSGQWPAESLSLPLQVGALRAGMYWVRIGAHTPERFVKQ